MTTGEPPAVQACRQTLAERPTFAAAVLVALQERDARNAELEAANAALFRENYRLRLSLAVHQKLLRLPAPIVQKIIDEHAAKARTE
jgi:hypothetical protein